MKPKKLKAAQTEAIALIDYLLAEVYESGQAKGYRLKMPYSHKNSDEVEMIIEIQVYFDKEIKDDTGQKLTVSSKTKH